MKLGEVRKTIATVVGSLCLWALAAWADGSEITRTEWISLIAAVGTPLGVYIVPNDRPKAS